MHSMHFGVCLCSIADNTEGHEHWETIDMHPHTTAHSLNRDEMNGRGDTGEAYNPDGGEGNAAGIPSRHVTT
jgi:hypothetical protein